MSTMSSFGDAQQHRARRALERQRRIQHIIEYGLAGRTGWHITIVHGRSLDASMRANLWHPLLTLIMHTFPGAAACTSVEWGIKNGVHMHAIVIGAPELTCEWVERAIERIQPGASCDFRPTTRASGAAWYLAKQVANTMITSGWPRYFRCFSMTRNWPVPPDERRRAKR